MLVACIDVLHLRERVSGPPVEAASEVVSGAASHEFHVLRIAALIASRTASCSSKRQTATRTISSVLATEL